MPTVSLMALTLDRYELTREVLTKNLQRARGHGHDVELLVADNGSRDTRVVDFVSTLCPTYHRRNSRNEGCGHAYNQLYLRAGGQYLVTMSNDLLMPENWVTDLLSLYKSIPNAGVVGADWGHGSTPELSRRLGVTARWITPQLDRVFGVWFFSRRVIDEIGFGWEGYDVYGMEDSDMMQRMNMAGFNSCYHPTMKCEHKAHDVGENSDYRRMKDASLAKNCGLYAERAARFNEDGVRAELPPMRDPL